MALGVTGQIGSCRLRARATAEDSANAADQVDGGLIAAGAVYPIVRWDADLGTCGSEPLTFGDPAAAATTVYMTTGAAGETFVYHFGPSTPAGGFTKTITADGSGRAWSDGTYAATCDGRLHATARGYVYPGLTGDGVYTIDTGGAGRTRPATCTAT